jgi:hypothetical protein
MRSSIAPFSALNFRRTTCSGFISTVDHERLNLSILKSPCQIDLVSRGPLVHASPRAIGAI